MFRSRKPPPKAVSIVIPEVNGRNDLREVICIVDIYSGGRVYRAGLDTIMTNSPVYANTSWAFEEMTENGE